MSQTRRRIAVCAAAGAALLLGARTSAAAGVNPISATIANAQADTAKAQERVEQLRKGKSGLDTKELDKLAEDLKSVEKDLAILKEAAGKCNR